MLYPLLFDDVFKDYIWGGRRLGRYGKKLPEGRVAESWVLSAHPDGLSRVADGPLAGKTLPELMHRYGTELVGSDLPAWATRGFPLLIKLLDARERLSVQVHPDDAYAAQYEAGSLGKNEMWYILEAEPEAEIVLGVVPGTTKTKFSQAVASGNIMEVLAKVKVRPGDAFMIPAGRVHAVGAGIVLAEIQQSSNITYRVYDYDRQGVDGKPRPLHLEQALDVIDFTEEEPEPGREWFAAVGASCRRRMLAAGPFFVCEHLACFGSVAAEAEGSRFFSYTVLKGALEITSGKHRRSLVPGQTVLIPAGFGTYRLSGTFEALLAYLPDRGSAEQAEQGRLATNDVKKVVLERNLARLSER
ncbi:MAG: mannose-6-phosphate isomerase [Deltaproteobacteria bacterium]|nr:MAG: mannose-6-phosphate isomerase [Deltaproteobacteria bacterium]